MCLKKNLLFLVTCLPPMSDDPPLFLSFRLLSPLQYCIQKFCRLHYSVLADMSALQLSGPPADRRIKRSHYAARRQKSFNDARSFWKDWKCVHFYSHFQNGIRSNVIQWSFHITFHSFDRFFEPLPYMSAKLWGEAEDRNYAEFTNLVGRAKIVRIRISTDSRSTWDDIKPFCI